MPREPRERTNPLEHAVRKARLLAYVELGNHFSHFIVVHFHCSIGRARQREEIGMRQCHLRDLGSVIGDVFGDLAFDEIDQSNAACRAAGDGRVAFTRNRQRRDRVRRR